MPLSGQLHRGPKSVRFVGRFWNDARSNIRRAEKCAMNENACQSSVTSLQILSVFIVKTRMQNRTETMHVLATPGN